MITRKNIVYRLLLITYVALLVAFAIAVGSRAMPRTASVKANPAATISSATAARHLDDTDESFPGVLLAPSSVEAAATIEGRLTAVNFRPGDVVEKDAVLATLDDRSYR